MPQKESVPKDKINLRLLLVDGKTHDFLFSPDASAAQIASYVFHNWPSDWGDDPSIKPDRPEVLRLIYRGRFMRSTTMLSSLSLPLGKTSTLHMIVRERLPDETQEGVSNTTVKRGHRTQSRCCTIL